MKKVKLDDFSSADLESAYGRSRSDLSLRIHEKGKRESFGLVGISTITSTEIRVAEVEEMPEREIIQQSVEDETTSYISLNQQQYNVKYKSHHINHRRMLEDNCYSIAIRILQFIVVYIIISLYYLIFFLTGINFQNSMVKAGKLSEGNSLIELGTINLLVLMKESINSDMHNVDLSDIYVQVKELISKSIELMKELEDVY